MTSAVAPERARGVRVAHELERRVVRVPIAGVLGGLERVLDGAAPAPRLHRGVRTPPAHQPFGQRPPLAPPQPFDPFAREPCPVGGVRRHHQGGDPLLGLEQAGGAHRLPVPPRASRGPEQDGAGAPAVHLDGACSAPPLRPGPRLRALRARPARRWVLVHAHLRGTMQRVARHPFASTSMVVTSARRLRLRRGFARVRCRRCGTRAPRGAASRGARRARGPCCRPSSLRRRSRRHRRWRPIRGAPLARASRSRWRRLRSPPVWDLLSSTRSL